MKTQERAQDAKEQIAEQTLITSADWYTTPDQAQAYLELMNNEYASTMVDGEGLLLQTHLTHIQEQLPKPVEYVDLGPGNGVKTAYMTRQLIRNPGIEKYIAVDVQEEYLRIAKTVVEPLEIPIELICDTFERAVPQILGSQRAFIYLGPTWGNFNQEIDELIAQSMSAKDVVYLSCGARPKDIAQCVQTYTASEVERMLRPVAKQKGMAESTYTVRFNKDRVEAGIIYEGEFHAIMQSKKLTKQEFEEEITRTYKGVFFSNNTHHGFVGRKK